MEDWQNGGFGIYIHWPYCQHKCPYCDFNSHVSQEIDEKRWKSAYISEIRRIANSTQDRVLKSVFFGGGTPSLMSPDLVAAIIDEIKAHWIFANDIEITLEANPTSVESSRFKGYADGGINRVSMGVQALNDADLKKLGRMHSVAEAQKAFEVARSRFDRVSFDLIYARQNQSLDSWKTELKTAISMAVDHFSLYQLTIEQGTAFGRLYDKGRLTGLPNEDLATDMFFATQEICEQAGLNAYEVSNHSKLGSESRHNLIYWRYGDYAGIGPGAHSRLTLNGQKYAIDTDLMPETWLNSVEKLGNGDRTKTSLSPEEQATEYTMMGLRLKEGINLDRLNKLAQTEYLKDYSYLISEDFITEKKGNLILTEKGFPLLNAVLREILP